MSLILLWSLSEVSEDKEECRCPCSTCCYVEPGDGDQWRCCDIRRCVDWPPRPALRSPAADRTNWQRSTSGHCPRLPPAVLQAASSTRSQHSFTSIRGLQVLLRCCYQWAPLCSWLIGGCFLITCTIYKCTDYSASHKIYKHEAWSMWGKHEDNLFWSVSVIPIMYVNK